MFEDAPQRVTSLLLGTCDAARPGACEERAVHSRKPMAKQPDVVVERISFEHDAKELYGPHPHIR